MFVIFGSDPQYIDIGIGWYLFFFNKVSKTEPILTNIDFHLVAICVFGDRGQEVGHVVFI